MELFIIKNNQFFKMIKDNCSPLRFIFYQLESIQIKNPYLLLIRFHFMGCVGSQADLPRTTIYSSKSPVIYNLSDKTKQKLIALIEKDDILNLAVAMSEAGAEPNSEISDFKMKWMLIHLCCRWDADNCLQYLLKHYFCEHPLEYIDFVNAPTVEGYTCLHLCALWKSEKCFYVLHHYGGLNLNAKDKMMKIPYETAVQYKCTKMKEILQTYKDLNINFTQIEASKLIGGEVIAQDIGTEMKKKQKSADESKKKLTKQKQQYSKVMNNLSSMQKQLLQQKNRLQKEKQALLQSKMKQQLNSDAQKARILADQTKNKVQQFQKLQMQKQMRIKIDEELKRQQQILLVQLKAKDEELNIVKENLKKQQQQRIKRQKDDAQKKAEQFILQKQQQINNRVKQKEDALNKLKKQEEQRAQKQKEQVQRRMKKVQEQYAKKQQELNKKLKQKQEQILRVKQQQEERIKKQNQSAQKMTQQAARKAKEDYDRKVKEKEQQMKKIKEQEAQKLRKQKQQAQKRALQIAKQQTAKLNQKLNQAKRKQEQAKSKARQVPQTINNTAKQLKEAYNKINQQVPAEIDRIYSEALSAGAFYDKQFPADNRSIGDPSKANFANFTTNTVWLRPRQILKGDFQLFDGIEPNDIKQGSLGVCYMLATISVLAQNPKNIQKIFVFADTRLGFYILKFFINGKPKFITVDDQIPCNKTTKSPLFTKPIGKQVWVLLLEKAWAKVIGDYLSAEAMTPDHMMQDLSSAPGFGSWFEKDVTKSNGEHIKTIIDNDKLGHAVVITSGDKKIQGIANNHAYSMLNAYQNNGRFIFKIRNPWGRFQWNGQYGDKSSLWTPQLKRIVGYQNLDDGVFYISQNQMTQAFCYYSISMIDQKSIYSWTQFTSKKLEDLFYKIKITKPGKVNIRITQLFERMLRDKSYKYSPIVFQFGKINSENNVKFISEGSQKSYFGAKSVHLFQTITQNLQAGQYFIRIRMLWQIPEKYSTAVLAAYGPQSLKFQRLTPQQGTKYMKALFISFSSTQARNATGDAFYKIVTMKGQFLFIAQTEKQGKYKVSFKFTKSKMQMAELDLGKVNQADIQLTLTKNEPGVGTAMRVDPAKGGTTGPVSIMVSKN